MKSALDEIGRLSNKIKSTKGFNFFGYNEPMTSLLPRNTFPEFYYFKRFTYDFHLVFKCAKETNSFASLSEAAYTRRERQVSDSMHYLQKQLGLRQKEMIFFGSTEFGSENRAHVHLLLSFDRLRAKGKTGMIQRASALMPSSLDNVRCDIFQNRIRIGHEIIRKTKNDQKKMLSYVCKKELGRAYKHFIIPSWLKTDAIL